MTTCPCGRRCVPSCTPRASRSSPSPSTSAVPRRPGPGSRRPSPSHPALIDTAHVTDELFGFVNVPMSVWIDEDGTLVRPAEAAQVRRSPLRDMDVPTEGLPERLREMLRRGQEDPRPVRALPRRARDWAEHGAASPLRPQARRGGRPLPAPLAGAWPGPPPTSSSASTCGEPVTTTRRSAGSGEAHRARSGQLDLQASGVDPRDHLAGRQPSDLLQGPTDIYEGNWLDRRAAPRRRHYYQPLDM